MKRTIISFAISAIITIVLIVIFNTSAFFPAPLGTLLSPQHGIWQNADAVNEDFNANLHFNNLKGKTEVCIDERLVPHIFAENEEDAFFVQGYLHAKFRLWQMEFQTYSAAGRLSEILGDKVGSNDIIDHDREFRRLGMVYAAEKALKEMEADTLTRNTINAYTAGVNAYIKQLSSSTMPIEYKLLGYKPEAWTNLKTALLLKLLSYNLAGGEQDFEYTNTRAAFGFSDFEKLFPLAQDSLNPIIQGKEKIQNPSVQLTIPEDVDSAYYQIRTPALAYVLHPDRDNGSNNWAINGKKTKSGAPILCNDPHLELNMPSLWFEMQIHTPTYNVYGATLPGGPSVIIGFNDSCSFGFTNSQRDVRDYYEVQFKNDGMQEYWYNGEWVKTTFRYENIKIKNQPDFIDSVAYTVWGPVMYDKKYTGNRTASDKYYAVRWKAHDPSNDLKAFLELDRAKNYTDYVDAITYMKVPGQNCAFAAKNGDIAMWVQGEFPAKWNRQGDFVMPGRDSSYRWQAMIPQEENPHEYNPERNFVSSANQLPVHPYNYPYYLGGQFNTYRSMAINRVLQSKNNFTVDDMMLLQNDNYNILAENVLPIFKRYINKDSLTDAGKKYWDILTSWNLRNDANETGITVFTIAWESLQNEILFDEYQQSKLPLAWPKESTLVQLLIKDSTFKFIDDIRTPAKETLREIVNKSFSKAVLQLAEIDQKNNLQWAKYKDTKLEHLLAIAPFSVLHLPVGGGPNVINATKEKHGPSWRMIVQLGEFTEAYGVYPGGQSGNPGSMYYTTFVDTWAAGKYYPLWLMQPHELRDKRVKWRMTFDKQS